MRKESAGPTRSRLSSRRSSKALPLAPSLENEAIMAPPLGKERRHSAIRFELDRPDESSGETLPKETSKQVELDVLTAKRPTMDDKSDCVLM